MSGRSPGLSGLVRLRDEEAWCRLALESFVDWCDELIVVLNTCTDRTPEIVGSFAAQHPDKVKVFDYPHRIHEMGPGHDRCPTTDERASAALYNFTQERSTFDHVIKLDGDMVMMDWAGARVRERMAEGHHRIKLYGTDLVGDDLRHIGCHPLCPTNGVYQAWGTRYEQGPVTQSLKGAPAPTAEIRDAFLHFKWARKSFAAATAQWPPDWDQIPHFQKIAERRFPAARYNGEYPASVAALLSQEAA